jgi:hypothetical protein
LSIVTPRKSIVRDLSFACDFNNEAQSWRALIVDSNHRVVDVEILGLNAIECGERITCAEWDIVAIAASID